MKNKQRTTNNEQRTHKAFTLIELLVAVGILAMVFSFASVIFRVSIDSHRTASANAEIMRKLRAITDQLNADFQSLIKDAPMALQFVKDSNDLRYDSVAFLSDGDFKSVRQYRYEKLNDDEALKTVSGIVASIYYGQAINPNILTRKQKILTSDDTLIDTPSLYDPNEFVKDSLAEWKVRDPAQYFVDWVSSLPVNPNAGEYIPMYLVDGISNFTIQWAQWDSGTFIWMPDISDFTGSWDTNADGIFGFFFNMPADITDDDWHAWSGSWPKALKFTFTLYDSKGIIKDGRTFTHIVYLDN